MLSSTTVNVRDMVVLSRLISSLIGDPIYRSHMIDGTILDFAPATMKSRLALAFSSW